MLLAASNNATPQTRRAVFPRTKDALAPLRVRGAPRKTIPGLWDGLRVLSEAVHSLQTELYRLHPKAKNPCGK